METNLLEYFTLLFGTAEAAGIFLLVLMLIWVLTCRGGFAWRSNPKNEFNWHPLLMTTGMVFLYGNAILIYRAFRNVRKIKLKITHTVINAAAFVISVVGLQAVFDSHNYAKPPIPNMYTLHSWLGISCVVLFICQWLSAFIIFLYPGLTPPMRAIYYPVHIFFGISTFITAIATTVVGFTEKALFSIPGRIKQGALPRVFNTRTGGGIKMRPWLLIFFFGTFWSEIWDYKKFPKEGILLNTMGFITVIFGILVLHLVTQINYKRRPLPEDELLLRPHEVRHKKKLKSSE